MIMIVFTLGDIICAQYSQDHNWYRAKCINAFSPSKPDVVPNLNNALPVEILYIDYGNSEWVPLTRYMFISNHFIVQVKGIR